MNSLVSTKFCNFFLIYFFLAVLGLRCCTRAFSSCSEQWLLFIAVTGLLTAAASLVAQHRLQAHRLQQLWLADSRVQAQQLWRTGTAALQHVQSSRTRARTRVPRTGRRILNHCATREAPAISLSMRFFSLRFSTLCHVHGGESNSFFPILMGQRKATSALKKRRNT